MLRVADVSIRFGDHVVLDGVDLDVADGEIVGLLGPSGSGKSTLLRVIAGIIAPDSGTVLLDGADVTSLPTHRRAIGMVFRPSSCSPPRLLSRGFVLRSAASKPPAASASVPLSSFGLGGFERADRRSRAASASAWTRPTLAPSPRLILLTSR